MATPVQAVQVVVTAVSYTPDCEPVHIHYEGVGVSGGPLAQSNICHTTQADLSARSGKPGYWGDAETKAELADHLAENGLVVTVADNTEPTPARDAAAGQGAALADKV